MAVTPADALPVEPVRTDLRVRQFLGASWRSYAVLFAIVAFLLALLLIPVGAVFITAFRDGDGSFTLGHFATFFSTGLMRESFANSLYVAIASVVVASLIATPLAYITVRFQFRGATLIQTLGVLPLIMPPFVGAVAMQLIFGRSGSVNLLLDETFGFSIPIMQGLTGVIFVESLHYFPFILMNLIVALRAIDGAMEEAALNLGAKGWRLFSRVVFPLAMPGYLAGAALVFIKVFDDLGTPLVLGQTNMLAPQAYLRITQVGLEDPLGYVISVIMIAFSILALWLSIRVMKGKDYSTLQKGGAGIARRRLSTGEAWLAYGVIGLVLLVVLSPHLGLLLLSFARVWSFSVLPDDYTLANYATVFADSTGMITNTLLYCGLAATIDVVIGVAIAYLILRTRIPARQWLDFAASAAIAVPGIVLAIGYLRTFQGFGDRWCTHYTDVAADHAGVFRAPTAIRTALMHGGATANQHQPRRGCRDAGSQQVALGSPRSDTADGRRHSRRLRIELHHRGSRTIGDDSAGRQGIASADELWHLSSYAVDIGPGRRCGTWCAAGSDGCRRHLSVACTC